MIAAVIAAIVAAAGTPGCTPAQLHGRVVGSEGAAGTILLRIELRSESACTVRGYPRLQLLGRRGPLPTRTTHGGLAILDRPVRTVRLGGTHRARVLVAYGDVIVGNETSCPVGVALRIGGVRVAARTYACGRGHLRESPYLQSR